jgi:hypothetical protein
LLPAVVVTAASVSDSAAGAGLLGRLTAEHPTAMSNTIMLRSTGDWH